MDVGTASDSWWGLVVHRPHMSSQEVPQCRKHMDDKSTLRVRNVLGIIEDIQ